MSGLLRVCHWAIRFEISTIIFSYTPKHMTGCSHTVPRHIFHITQYHDVHQNHDHARLHKANTCVWHNMFWLRDGRKWQNIVVWSTYPNVFQYALKSNQFLLPSSFSFNFMFRLHTQELSISKKDTTWYCSTYQLFTMHSSVYYAPGTSSS